jgi:AraC-like DNA-binding protein
VETVRRQDDLVLGQASRTYRMERVVPALRNHFACRWHYRAPAGRERKTAVVPHGCADLMWENGRVWVTGPNRTASIATLRPGTTIVAFRFQPGAAALWLGLPASEIVGARLPLDRIHSNHARRLLDSLGDARDPEIVASRFERTLAEMSKEIRPPEAFGRVIFRTLGRGCSVKSRITWELASLFATSERTLRRRCEESFGYGPKTLDRILRMQRFLVLASAYGRLGLASLAGAVGYADQAHLSREARRLTGLTPRAILAQLAYSSDQAPIDFGNDKNG